MSVPSKENEGRDLRGLRQFSRGAPGLGAGAAALHGRLELTARRELRHRGCRDRHFLRRIAGIHALALCAPLGHEFSEAREGHFPAALQRVGDCVEEGVYGLRRIATREVRAPRDLVNELLFRQVPLLLSTNRTTGKDPNSSVGLAQPCGFAGLLSRTGRSSAPFLRKKRHQTASTISLARKIGRRRTAWRASASAPPSSRSTTRSAV